MGLANMGFGMFWGLTVCQCGSAFLLTLDTKKTSSNAQALFPSHPPSLAPLASPTPTATARAAVQPLQPPPQHRPPSPAHHQRPLARILRGQAQGQHLPRGRPGRGHSAWSGAKLHLVRQAKREATEHSKGHRYERSKKLLVAPGLTSSKKLRS